MSGVVMHSAAAAAAAAAARRADDDDDVAGLLEAVEEEDEEGADEDGDQLEPGRSGGFRSVGRIASSSSRSRSSRSAGMRRYGRDPYTVVRSTGTIGQLFNTLMLCCVFFGLGFTKALLDQSKTRNQEPSPAQTAGSVGYLSGFLIGAFLLSRFSRFFIVVLGTVTLGVTLTLVPWTSTPWAVNAVYAAVGAVLAVLMAGGNVVCLDYWGRRSGPYVQAMHFCLSLGLLAGPQLVEPLSQARIPEIVGNTLAKFSGNGTSSISSDQLSFSITSTSPLPEHPKYDINLRRRKRSIDPLLLELFGGDGGSEKVARKKTVKPKKPKPSFTDGMKLDRSRDWERVKVAKPPKEEVEAPKQQQQQQQQPVKDKVQANSSPPVVAEAEGPSIEDVFRALGVPSAPLESTRPTTTSASTTTSKSSNLQLIQEEMRSLEEDMARSRKLVQKLKSQQVVVASEKKEEPRVEDFSMKRRRKRGLRSRGPEFNPRRRYNPNSNRFPARDPDWRLGPGADYDRDYNDYDPRLGLDPYQRRQEELDYAGEPPPQLGPPPDVKVPEKVKEAEKTLVDFFTGKNITDDDSGEAAKEKSSTKAETTTTTTTTITTTTTTTTTTSEAKESTLSIQKKIDDGTRTSFAPRHKKPTSSFDNGTDSAGGGGTFTVRNILSNYGVTKPNVGFILDAVYTILLSLVLLVCLCYHPREPRSRQEDGSSKDSSSENRIFKCTLLMLLFCFTLLHWGMFVTLREVLPKFDILAKSASYLQQVFVGVFTATRFLLTFTSAGLISPAVTLFLGLVVTFAGSLTLVFAQEISAAAVWAGVIMQSVGLSSLLPTSLVWGEAYVLMTPQVVAVVCSGMALGELGVPLLFERLTLEAQTWLGFTMLGCTTLSLGLFVCVFLVARKHGSRFSRPQTAGYELASQEELNQELLDDEDEEDFEVSSGPPTLRLKSVGSADDA